jgi:putative glutamine amidotransferase
MDTMMKIAVSRLSLNYETWLRNLDKEFKIVDHNGMDPADFRKKIGQFSGLVLSGGGDIHPSLYGNPDTEHYCQGIDIKRDDLEFNMLEAALTRGIPVLAICRGMQILNVFLGGTLIPHIAALSGHIRHKDQQDVQHEVSISAGSQLFHITGVRSETANSSHHQAIDKLGSGLVISAYSADGIAEAAELSDPDRQFCVAVQWHPERMNLESPLSGKIGRAFLNKMMNDE